MKNKLTAEQSEQLIASLEQLVSAQQEQITALKESKETKIFFNKSINVRYKYCNEMQACLIIGLDHIEYLHQLTNMGVLPYVKGKHVKYLKSDCYKSAELLDNGSIKLDQL